MGLFSSAKSLVTQQVKEAWEKPQRNEAKK
jgi:hypothetical protein